MQRQTRRRSTVYADIVRKSEDTSVDEVTYLQEYPAASMYPAYSGPVEPQHKHTV